MWLELVTKGLGLARVKHLCKVPEQIGMFADAGTANEGPLVGPRYPGRDL